MSSLEVATVKAAGPARTNTVARFVAIKPGSPAEFESGYRKHLDWHRKAGDTWNWVGWTVVTGDRIGHFVDGTFGRSLDELDRPVDPMGDRADLAINVAPFGSFVAHDLLRERPELSSGTLPNLTSPICALITIELGPGRLEEFVEGAGRLLRSADGTHLPSLWYERVAGGSVPSLLVFVLLRGWSEAATLDAAVPWLRADVSARSRGDGEELHRRCGAAVKVELLQYRRDLSLITPDLETSAVPNDRTDIEACIDRYVEATRKGSGADLRTAFWPDARICSVKESELTSWTVDQFAERIQSAARPTRRALVTSLSIDGDMATADVMITDPGVAFGDHLVLLRGSEGWRIVSKTFRTLPVATAAGTR